jgi:hypothetical protein
MRIASETGIITFANGIEIGPELTQDVFRALPRTHDARSEDHGTPPWIHYYFSGGQIDEKELLVGLCFYDQALVHVNITADLYPPGPNDWSRYSLDVEAVTKHFHDHLLEEMFGKPSKGGNFLFRRLPTGQETLDRPFQWNFSWGNICSYHDSRGGGTYITIGYGNRRVEAERAYRRRSATR